MVLAETTAKTARSGRAAWAPPSRVLAAVRALDTGGRGNDLHHLSHGYIHFLAFRIDASLNQVSDGTMPSATYARPYVGRMGRFVIPSRPSGDLPTGAQMGIGSIRVCVDVEGLAVASAIVEDSVYAG